MKKKRKKNKNIVKRHISAVSEEKNWQNKYFLTAH